MSDEPNGYEQALGAVPWTPDTEPSEVVIRRMRDGVEVGERFEPRQRGDTYRARALGLLRSARYNKYWKRHWKDMVVSMAGKLGAEAGLRTACDMLNKELAAAREHAAISIARAASAELLAAAAASLSAERDAARAEAATMAEVLRGIQGMAEEELRTEELRPSTIMWQIEADARAALSARAQPPAKTVGTGDGA